MAIDATFTQATTPVIVVGSDSTGAETTPIRSYPDGELAVADILNTGGVQSAMTVGTSAIEAKVGASRLTNRKLLTICPTDGDIYWGYTNAITTTTGTPIFKNQMVAISVGDTAAVYLVASANRNVRITEGA